MSGQTLANIMLFILGCYVGIQLGRTELKTEANAAGAGRWVLDEEEKLEWKWQGLYTKKEEVTNGDQNYS